MLYQNEFIDISYATNTFGLRCGIITVDEYVPGWHLKFSEEDVVFVEDCYFERCRSTQYCLQQSFRYVFRHNTVRDHCHHGLPWMLTDPEGTKSVTIIFLVGSIPGRNTTTHLG
ncbi:MAG: hypothetical protein M2R45_05176 [Verrucomicrobia subdivision 3 bacterium]|nr:hypothetical protein [Limisphaerales bacterium]MCS1416296.1 hypothetical protein [Limisphaerales bacterium]